MPRARAPGGPAATRCRTSVRHHARRGRTPGPGSGPPCSRGAGRADPARSCGKGTGSIGQRRERLSQERHALEDVDEASWIGSLANSPSSTSACAASARRCPAAEATLPALEQTHREATEAAEQASRELSSLDARQTALELLQRQVSRSGEMHAWLDNHQLDGFGRLWQGIRIEPGWEDALEAVLRERLNGIALDDLQRAAVLARPAPARQDLLLSEAQPSRLLRHRWPSVRLFRSTSPAPMPAWLRC